jgi:uncharacterized protein with von Willebrand factor type A (vWA) domain
MAAAEGLAGVFVGFARLLRRRGLDVGTGQVVRYQAALSALDPSNFEDLYWAGNNCLVTSRSQRSVYDQAFAEYFLGAPADEGATPLARGAGTRGGVEGADDGAVTDVGSDDTEEEAEGSSGTVGALASAIDVARGRRLVPATAEELAHNRELGRRLRWHLPRRKARRTRPIRRGDPIDLRRTVRASLRTDGEILRHTGRRHRKRARPVLLFLDVSGSMSASSRELLWFARAVCASGVPAEVFCFGTRIVRVTDQLLRRDAQEAVAAAAARVLDWDGGTRIGDALQTYRTRWGRTVQVRGGLVLVCSDGLECGDPDVLASEVAGLRRLAHRVVWVNPLKDDPGFQPLTRGMQAVLPHIDELVGLRAIGDLSPLCRLLDRAR